MTLLSDAGTKRRYPRRAGQIRFPAGLTRAYANLGLARSNTSGDKAA
jgi:hypothetical protein